ncbi:Hsp20/alpha crystallin family protein [Niastella vici]|uniref:Hsp20/alpha crystallin family protein n=1 Tax=Niastella vici TaxID=1703345 RepID=UPI00117C4063|nr:Hsp20/alpha crystallin family protein [Niastella vici]
MVKNPKYHYTGASIYPGIYQPVFTREQEPIQVKNSKPPVNIIEFPDYYQIEMPVPGFQNNNFFIKTQGCSLLIVARKEFSNAIEEAHYHLHGFRYQYITRNIDLPHDADTEFGTAEYKNGVLYIYVYKTSCPMQNNQNFIIVY